MNLYLKNKTVNIDVPLYLLAFIILCGLSFLLGYVSLSEGTTNHMPTVDVDVLSSRDSGSELAVRRAPDGMVAYLSGICSSSCPQFEAGDRITLERWKDKYDDVVYVYHWENENKDTTYMQGSHSGGQSGDL
jgi:hypothetical protein